MESVRGHPNPLNTSKATVIASQPHNQLSKKLGPDALRQAALVLLDSNPELKAMLDTAVTEKDEALRERNAAFRMHEEISAKYKESMRTCENIRLALTRAADEAAREKKESGEQVAFLLDTIKQLTVSKELLVNEKLALEKFFQEKLSAAECERTLCLKTLDAVREESSVKIEAKMEETAKSKLELAAAMQKVESTQQMYEKLYDTEVRYVRNVLIPETNCQREAAEKAAKQAILAAAQSDMETQSSKMREKSTQEAYQILQKTLLAAQEDLEEQKSKVDQAQKKIALEEQKARDAMSHAVAAEESFQMASKLLQSKCDLEIEALVKKCESDVQQTKSDCEMAISAAKAQNESDIRMIRQLSDVEVAKHKAVAENASKSALDYASLHGYESWMQALQSAQEEARQSRENEIEAMKQTGYVIEELKRMTMHKERAELETKQVIARYGGLSMTQLFFPSEMESMEDGESSSAIHNPIKEHQKQNTGDSSSFFSSFRRKLKEKFASFAETKEDKMANADETIENTRWRSSEKQNTSARNASASSNLTIANGKSSQSPVYSPQTQHSPQKVSSHSQIHSPPKMLQTRGIAFSDELPSSNSSLNRNKNSPTSPLGHENTTKTPPQNGFQKMQHSANAREYDASTKPLAAIVLRAEESHAASRSRQNEQRFKKDGAIEYSSRPTHKGDGNSSRPSSADSGSIQSAREVCEGRLPAQYQNFRARQSNLSMIPKLSFVTPKQADPSSARYQMRRDVSVTDPLQCAWLQKSSGPLVERIHVDFDVRVELVQLTERRKMSGVQIAFKGHSLSVQSAVEFIFSIIDNLRQVAITLHQFDSTNPSFTVSEHEDEILKDLRVQLKRLDQLPSYWPIDVDAKMLDLEMPKIPSPKSPKNAQFRSLQNPIIVTAVVSDIDRHFIDVISGNMKQIAEHLGLRA